MECLYYDLHHEGLHNDIHVTTIQPFVVSTFEYLKSSAEYVGYVVGCRTKGLL